MNSILLFSNGEKEKLKISFVIPTYKRSKYLFDAINSILAQPWDGSNIKYEILVINNDPTADMCDLIEQYKDCNISFYCNEENYGQVNNINRGILLARGEYVALLHDDDIILENYLNVISKYICSDEKYDCLVPSYYEFYDKYVFDLKHKLVRTLFFFRYLYRKPIQQIRPKDDLYSFHDVFNAPTCGALYLKEKLVEYGLFEDKYGAAWDSYNYSIMVSRMNIFLIHDYIGGKRAYTGMSNDPKVKREFREYIHDLKDQYLNDKRMMKYTDCLNDKKPLIKYLRFRIKCESFMYLHNLDGVKVVPYRRFKKMKESLTF